LLIVLGSFGHAAAGPTELVSAYIWYGGVEPQLAIVDIRLTIQITLPRVPVSR
jgi:hypothetical protein